MVKNESVMLLSQNGKMNYWKVQIHVITDFNNNLNLIHYLSHNFQRCLGKLKVKTQTGHWNGSNGISNKKVSDKFIDLSCYLLKYKLIVCYSYYLSLFISFFSTLQRTEHWKITRINPLKMYRLQYIHQKYKLYCHKEKYRHHKICLNLWIKTHCLTWT